MSPLHVLEGTDVLREMFLETKEFVSFMLYTFLRNVGGKKAHIYVL